MSQEPVKNEKKMLINVLCAFVKRARQFSLVTLSHEQMSREVSHE